MTVKKLIALLSFLILLLAACGTTNNGMEQDFNMSTENQDIPTLTNANNQLGFDLLSLSEADEEGNIFISPSSLYLALSLANNGADGETKEEMDKLLGFSTDETNVLNETNHALLKGLTEEKEGIDLHIANSIWLNQNFSFQDDFSQQMEEYYQAKIEEIDVMDPNAADEINQWVEEQTNNRIQDIVESPLNQDLIAFLINTIYFEADWMHPFNPELTTTENFHLADGSSIDVDMMTLSEELDYFEKDGLQAVSLPYGEGEMNMQLFLPEEGADMEAFQEQFTLENWEEWQEAFSSREGQVKMPAFELEYEASLNDTLQSLGMTTAFDEQADFTKMVEETDEVWISDVKQKTFLLVDEEGTEAAAATSVEIETTSAPMPTDEPFLMEINRPFFLFITDDETGAILFAGKVASPPPAS